MIDMISQSSVLWCVTIAIYYYSLHSMFNTLRIVKLNVIEDVCVPPSLRY